MAVYCLLIIKNFELKEKINYFILNNVGNNNLVINAFCKELKLKNLKTRHLRCLKYVINLATKTFLFRKKKNTSISRFLN